jgi:hypothetical protein
MGIVLPIVASVASAAIPGSAQSSRDAAREWFLEVQEDAYEAAMPMRVPDLLVAFRTSHEMYPDTHERYFAIQYMRFGKGFIVPDALKATVIQPVGASVQTQLINLRMRDRGATLPELVSRLSLRKEITDVDGCSAILDQVKRLSGLRFSIPRRDIVTLDAPLHHVAVNVGNLKMTAAIEGTKDPLVAWGVRTHDLLRDCLRDQRDVR